MENKIMFKQGVDWKGRECCLKMNNINKRRKAKIIDFEKKSLKSVIECFKSVYLVSTVNNLYDLQVELQQKLIKEVLQFKARTI